MFRMKANVENVRASLIKSRDFQPNKSGDYERHASQDPPRTMGDGFAVIQTAMVQFYYHQDLLGNSKKFFKPEI